MNWIDWILAVTLPVMATGSVFDIIEFFKRRNAMPGKGDSVLYVDEFDSDQSYSPNISVGLVVKVYPNNVFDLVVFFSEGFFVKRQVPMGGPNDRMTWHAKISS